MKAIDNFLPKIDTFERNSSYILRLRIVEPIRIRRYESRSMPHNFTSVEDEAYIGNKRTKLFKIGLTLDPLLLAIFLYKIEKG